ncbi:hypothetical protein HY631_05010 [Candidatus Uhrbacteria bacterium]|nr:hypothetical protein [Candidatus Uhrbacteria bacterium]
MSATSYVVFWVMDLAIPGFVSRYFSVHLFLLSAIMLGLAWASLVREYEERPWIHTALCLALGLLAAVLVWKTGEELEGYRFLISVIALLVPSIVYSLMKD